MLESYLLIAKNINMDKDYINVLNTKNVDLLSICRDNNHLVSEQRNYSFLNYNSNQISVGIPYSVAIQGNYIAFQNKHYSNKWFFAWIDSIEYVSEKTTLINYTIDVWSTYYSNLTIKSCFVMREHVNSDDIGENTIPENVDLGKSYIVESETPKLFNDSKLAFLVGPSADDYVNGRNINGIFGALGTESGYSLSQIGDFNVRINAYHDDYSRIQRIIQYPAVLSTSQIYSDNINIEKLNTIDGYEPKNKKLLTFPFKQLKVLSSNGDNVTLQHELFSGDNDSFEITGSLLPECFLSIIPKNYRGLSKDFTKKITMPAEIECTWGSGTYTNGIVNKKTSDALNLVSNAILTGISIAAAPETGGTSLAVGTAVVSGVTKLGNSSNEYAKARNESGSVKQGSGNNVIDLIQNNLGFRFLSESIKAEYARKIDNYFTRFGYAIENLKIPNTTGRRNWNYVEIGPSEDLGYGDIPHIFMEKINQIARKGVTIWHNHSNIGNFSLDNSII